MGPIGPREVCQKSPKPPNLVESEIPNIESEIPNIESQIPNIESQIPYLISCIDSHILDAKSKIN